MKPYRLVAMSIVSMVVLVPRAGGAQDTRAYPVKPIRLVVAQTAGGAADIQMRLFAQAVGEILGQQIVVDNRAGGGAAGIPALTMVAHANPDGYTLMHVGANFTFTPALVAMPIDPIKDFAPVSLLTRNPYLLVVPPAFSIKSVKELIALARAQPGKLNFGAGNVGSGTHLASMLFLSAANIRTTYVPYKSTGPALIDLIAGRIDASLTSVVSSGPHVKAGRLRALGISLAQRSVMWPDIPTIAEQGVPSYNASALAGWAAPAKTPVALLHKLAAAAAKAVHTPLIIERIKDDGGEPVGSTPEQFRELIAVEVPRWRKLVKELGIAATVD
jgi:tripartite-type tricarboxylate transporter receptor subunit TctC